MFCWSCTCLSSDSRISRFIRFSFEALASWSASALAFSFSCSLNILSSSAFAAPAMVSPCSSASASRASIFFFISAISLSRLFSLSSPTRRASSNCARSLRMCSTLTRSRSLRLVSFSFFHLASLLISSSLFTLSLMISSRCSFRRRVRVAFSSSFWSFFTRSCLSRTWAISFSRSSRTLWNLSTCSRFDCSRESLYWRTSFWILYASSSFSIFSTCLRFSTRVSWRLSSFLKSSFDC
mmetsp:Transcript_38769/g.91695  ORF Transcript_38769/g.91695 Transcript_38769/m.91695 type:complete len:238 (-) Transcript_38769:447-1160(-)